MIARWVTSGVGCAAACALGALGVGAQAPTTESTVVTAAGAQYSAGLLHRWILGRHYRDLWTEPLRVEVLDLGTFAGGLEPLRTGGGMQTRALRFGGADGREYTFRSVDKDPSPVLDSILRDTFVDDLVQDGISAAHPFGALVAPPLLDAVGILHVDPRLVVMPDDPALGEFRAEFAGMLGMIEELPDENEGERTSFAGTLRVIGSETLVERLMRGPDDRVDALAFLEARLVDVFLGDWDRHRDQWRWAVYSDDVPRRWLPVPRDRDQAFAKFDGLATRIVGLYMPQFVTFAEDYPSITRLHWNARELDRWFLSGLERAAWNSVGSAVMASLDDRVIESAVGRLPPEIRALNGEELTTAMRARREALPEAWDEFYRLLARRVDVRLTDADDEVTVERIASGSLRVSAGSGGEVYFDRRFVGEETEEIRVFLASGNDRVVFRGGPDQGPLVRIIGGGGDDTFEFSSQDTRVRLYDSEDGGTATGNDAPSVDRAAFAEWVWSEEDRDQPRDWGRRVLPVFWSSYDTDLGVFVGGGAALRTYGFRKRPYAGNFDFRAGVAPALGKFRAELDGRLNTENSRLFVTLGARVSRLDVIHYYGPGNDTGSGGRDYHAVDQTTTAGRLGLGLSLAEGVELTGGIALERLSTRDGIGRFYGTLGPVYGGGAFVQGSGVARLLVDPLATSETTAHRVRLDVSGAVFPPLVDVERVFGKLATELSVLLASSPMPRVALALRANADQVWGRFPWHQSAFLGGPSSLAGWDQQRFAGDLALSGAAELRLRVLRPRVILPVDVGVFGLADGGRVYLDGASPGGWHTSLGGGVWIHPVLQPYMVRVGVAAAEQTTKIFATLALPY